VTVTRWTIRGVEDALIEQVRAVHRRTSFPLGRIVSAAITLGLPAALAELRDHAPRPRLRARGFFAMLAEITKASHDESPIQVDPRDTDSEVAREICTVG
jgi:hypothetical protein